MDYRNMMKLVQIVWLLMPLVVTPIHSKTTHCHHEKHHCGPNPHPNLCPPWTTCNKPDDQSCSCASNIEGAIECTGLNSFLSLGYCISYNRSITSVGRCPYEFQNATKNKHFQLTCSNSDLDDQFCEELNRFGHLCAKCIEDYGTALYSYDLKCHNCTGRYQGWGLYILLELSTSTLFFCIIVFCHISATTASMNAFVLLSQVTVAVIGYSPSIYEHSLGNVSHVLLKIYRLCYGIWNLDFFRQLIPSFCVSKTVTNIQGIALQYVSAVYPLCLIGLAYMFIELHGRNFRLIVWFWAPFHRCFARCRRTCNPRTSIVDAFATFLLLSYSKLLVVSTNILSFTTVYTLNTTEMSAKPTSETALFWDPSLKPFSPHHLPFAIISITVFSTFVALPPLFLLFYPTEIFQNCLGHCFQDQHALRTFADAFQRCFKDGTEGTRDCRYFAGLYFIIRIALFTTHTLIPNYMISWIVPAVICLLSSISFGVFRPYKSNIFNAVDCTLLGLYSIAITLMILSHFTAKNTTFIGLFAVIFIITFIPLLYISLYVSYVIATQTTVLQTCKNCIWLNCVCIQHNDNESLPDRILNPEEYRHILGPGCQVNQRRLTDSESVESIVDSTVAVNSIECSGILSEEEPHNYGATSV